ncbi:2-hydroxyacid dehydrogenase [Fodinibius halophilus]|uniref:D-glycerate dehydrogenase n=1 Tax=Fodinibius halophilus TaxID=1736908 RepID=A0A6M1TKE8_9BACT|nr:D-glycerate dehydrogenase [Fodinibius halophilus]NGP89020.1 D-glycerate dehydrogenase [Fodinibius halophilus]
MAKRVLVTEPIIPSVIEKLQKHFTVDVGERGKYNTEEQLKENISDYHAILPMLSNPITESVLSEATNLEIVANHAVGYNNIDLDAAQKSNIKVANTPGVLSDSCAEFTLGLMLAVARRFYDAQEYLLEGKFESWEPLGFLGMELQGKTLGIIGMGRIGQAVAKRARAMGMDIIYHNRSRVSDETEQKLNASYYSSHKELAQSTDFLTLHCPLTDETRHLIDAEVLRLMPRHAILINTSRGPVVEEAALAEALHNNTIGGAALDVFENEPEVHPNLQDAPNCLLTPHMASASYKTREDIGMLAANAIIGVLNGKADSEIPNLIQP